VGFCGYNGLLPCLLDCLRNKEYEMKIKGYYVVRHTDFQYFQNEVNILISQGWQPFGSFFRDDSGYYQAVTRNWGG
jgi:hypothetical protein